MYVRQEKEEKPDDEYEAEDNIISKWRAGTVTGVDVNTDDEEGEGDVSGVTDDEPILDSELAPTDGPTARPEEEQENDAGSVFIAMVLCTDPFSRFSTKHSPILFDKLNNSRHFIHSL